MAECLDLTAIHVDRPLKELRDQNIVQSESGRVTILNRQQLEEVAKFDPAYLYLEPRTR